MRKLLSFLLILTLLVGLCACGGDGGEGMTSTQPQGSNDVELSQEIWGRSWISSPDHGGESVRIHPNGICEISGMERTYTVVHTSDTEVVLDAGGTELHFTLHPSGIHEMHLGGDWDNHYVQDTEYWDLIYQFWSSDSGECIEIFPAGISTPMGFFQEYRYDTDSLTVEVLLDSEVIYTIINGIHELRVTDVDGNEILYTREIEYEDPDPGHDEPMDEELRLNFAYNKALDDFNAAISDQPVYDDEGNKITGGPALAEYLYDQFVALGDYEDAAHYLPFFKTRTEIVTTEQWYSPVNGYEREYVHDLPEYDVFGRLDNEVRLGPTFGIYYNFSGNKDVHLVYNEQDVVSQVIITMTDGFGKVKGTCVADLEYNEWEQHIATHVAFVDEAGNDVRYTSTLEYDNEGRLIRVDIPYVVDNCYDHTYTYQYRYDALGRCVQTSTITTVVDESWYAYGKQPGFKYVTENFYNEHGLLVRQLTHSVDYLNPGGGHYESIYTYDEDQRLVKEEMFTQNYSFDDYYKEHGIEKTNELQGEYLSDFFYPGVPYDEATLEDWFSMEQPVDISKWDAFLVSRDLQDVSTYTYSETAIMYIDLTPED